jgi:phosphoglycolate phosphatase-like HAD superfamily hydrolase
MNNLPIYALDFDGVICDSTVETGMTGWKAACAIWPDMNGPTPQDLIEAFRHIRPLLETGYEAILGMRLLAQGKSTGDIAADYQHLIHQLLEEGNLTVALLKQRLGATRDAWIAGNLGEWIQKNPLYPGAAAKLKALGEQQTWYVVTTKQERFVDRILSSNGIDLDPSRIYGLERNISKPEILSGLLQAHPDNKIVFIEDRLPALLSVAKVPALQHIVLQLSLWGYNTDADKAEAARLGIRGINLDEFLVVQ